MRYFEIECIVSIYLLFLGLLQDLTRPNAKNQLTDAARAVTESINHLVSMNCVCVCMCAMALRVGCDRLRACMCWSFEPDVNVHMYVCACVRWSCELNVTVHVCLYVCWSFEPDGIVLVCAGVYDGPSSRMRQRP